MKLGAPRRPNGVEIVMVAAVLLWLAITLPWVLGDRILVQRDTLTTHRHFKAFGAEQLAAGRIPAVNPHWGLGQPFRGNPNALPFYPGNLFYLVLPFDSAFGLHYALHWLLGFLGMRSLARELGQGEAASSFSAIAWAGSGWMLSLLTFYNLLAVVAWLPFALWGVARGGRRGVALGGLACGLMLLGGEPVTAAIGVPVMAFLALDRHGWRRGAAAVLAVLGIGLLVALPQVVATARVAGFASRVVAGLEPAETTAYGFHPLRLFELLLPLPWGWPADFGRFAFWSQRVTPEPPYIYTLHFGVVAAALAVAAVRRQARWALFAALGLALAWAATAAPGLVTALSGGLFRYPQKFLLLFCLPAALLAGWGLEAVLGKRGFARALAVGGCALALLGIALRLARTPFVEWLRTRLATDGQASLAATAAGVWIVGLIAAGVLLLAAAWAVRRSSPAALLGVQLAGLLQLAPVLVTDAAAPYRQPPPLLASVGEPRAVVPVPFRKPPWEARPEYPAEVATPIGQARLDWFELEPAFGVALGLSYPVAPDLEGLNTPPQVLVQDGLQQADWSGRVPWLARLGVGWVVRFAATPASGLERVRVEEQFGVPVELDRVPDPAPPLAWPAAIAVIPDPYDAFRAIHDRRIPPAVAVTDRPVAHRAGGRVSLVEREPDRWVFDVGSDGGLAVLQTAWHPIWKARLEDGRALPTRRVDIALTGIEVPAGRHRVTLAISSWPETIAGAVALVTAAVLLFIGLRRAV